MGDVTIGDCRLMLGDCLERLKELPNGSVDCVVTDPPYMLGAASARRSADKAIGWADINNASHWYSQWFARVWDLMGDDCSLWVFGNWRSFPVYQCAASKVPGMSVLSVVVWDKEWPSVGSTRGLRQNYELIVLFGKPGFGIADRALGDIWRCKWTSAKPTGHPQEKPVELIARMLDVAGLQPGSSILDPFMGSGSTALAAMGKSHRFVGIEMDDDHFALARRRLTEQHDRRSELLFA
jgi:DNA modification methylase